MQQLAGQVALVTGGSRGIGAAIARRLAAEGATVALTYVDGAEAARTVAKDIATAGGQAHVIRADSADPAAVVAAVEETAARFGRIDILVNSAGIIYVRPLDELTIEEADRMWAIDVRAVFVASQAAARHMTRGGRIITIGSSMSGRVPGGGFTLYAMCKAALTGLTRALARDLGPRGISAVVVHPGAVDTDMNPADGPGDALLTPLTTLGRFGTPEEIAGVVSFLAGPDASYITGSALTVDGGLNA
jgi:3-oxoacyl-[acyl-carrier protein] reductase